MKKYIKKIWWRYLIGGTSLILSILMDMWFPLITMAIVDDVIVDGHIELLSRYLVYVLIAGAGRGLFQYFKEFMCDMAGCDFAETMRKDMLRHIQGLSKRYFDKNNTGELMARVKDDTGRMWDLFGFCGMLIIEASLYLVGVLICMIKLNWKLSLIPIVFLPILGVLVMKLEKQLDKIYENISEENATLTSVIEENISGVRTVKAFARESFEIDKFDEHNSKYNDLNLEQANVLARLEPIIGFIPKAMQITVLAFAGYWAITGAITYGTMVAFLQYAANIVWPIENMGWLINVLAASLASHKKIKTVYAATPEITDPEAPVSIEAASEEPKGLVFDQVSFSIDDKPLLTDVSFILPEGKTLGIMGATGAGKTTIVNLLERFYDVTSGAVRINGHDVKELSTKDVRNYSSVVTQDIFLFSDTISENVKLGHKATMKRSTVEKAVSKAHAMEFVVKLNGGFDAVIGEKGIGLSGGQKQRLSIARALAKKSGVLVLDDSTSALDMETEWEIQKELKEKKDMSKIIIAHRISSVKDADEIIILNEGRVVERGNHKELMSQKGAYYNTYCTQYGIPADEEVI